MTQHPDTPSSQRSVEELIIYAGAGALALLGCAGITTWGAAHLVMIVHEQRLLDPASGAWIDIAAALLDHPTDPSHAFAARDMQHLPRGAGLYAVAAPLLAAAVCGAASGYRALRAALPTSGGRSSGEGRWATPREMRRLYPARGEKRLVLGFSRGKLIACEMYHSVAAFGPTGSSKTTAVVIPALLEHEGPVMALSARSDMMRPTRAARAARGPVYVYDPLGITGEPCAAWSPLRTCKSWKEAHRVAHALTSIAASSDQQNQFWTGMGRKLLCALLHAAALEDLTMRDVVRWIDTRDQTEVAAILAHHHADDALQSFTASLARNERTLADIYASAELLLAAYAIPGMADTRPSESLDPQELIKQNATLYVIAPTEDQELLQPVLCALFKDMYRAAIVQAERSETGQLDPGMLFVIDEAAQLTPLKDLAEIAATCRGYGIQLVTIFQDYAQVKARWGAKAPTIVNNHSAIVLLPGQADHDLLQLFTRLAGERTEQTHTQSRSHQHGASSSTGTRYRPLVAVHQLRQLSDDTAILLYRNLPPIPLKLRPYWRDPHLMSLTHPRPQQDAA